MSTASSSSEKKLQKQKKILVNSLPNKSRIFLPTKRMALEEQVEGLKRVQKLYSDTARETYKLRLQNLKAGLKGKKRCFLIGNGPSLNKMDLSLLENEITFAVNGFFLKSKELNWTPTFYLVEDHLVAEDRKDAINQFRGPIKLFPNYLGYCFPEADDTIFYNHRPRISYPHGFDFSLKADEITYAGCTVIFSAMQMAAYLGFTEIYLIGVDANYEIPKDVKADEAYGTSVFDMDSDDKNHFHPDYFGKGYRWHDPQVDKMLEAYKEAEKVSENANFKFYNATVGGKLEAFERRNYTSLFPNIQSEGSRINKTSLPKILVLDFTEKGGSSATGALKKKFFKTWDPNSFLLIFGEGDQGSLGVGTHSGSEEKRLSEKEAVKRIKEFNPDFILYRPVNDHKLLHNLALKTLNAHKKPYALWFMDDWPSRLRMNNPELADQVDDELISLCRFASKCFAISEKMAGAFGARYGTVFEVFHNGIEVENWRSLKAVSNESDVVKIRYAGALAQETTLKSILDIADAVETLGQSGKSVQFEILTNERWEKGLSEIIANRKYVSGGARSLDDNDYRAWLQNADVLVIANNFDPFSISYLKYSFANKIPECLASGAVVLAYGPEENGTIEYLSNAPGAITVTSAEKDKLLSVLTNILNDPERRNLLGKSSRKFAADNLNMDGFRRNFENAIKEGARECSMSKTENRLKFDTAKVGSRQLGKKPFVRQFVKYVVGWKGLAGLTSACLTGLAFFVGIQAENSLVIILAACLLVLSQGIMFFLIAHLAAHINVRG